MRGDQKIDRRWPACKSTRPIGTRDSSAHSQRSHLNSVVSASGTNGHVRPLFHHTHLLPLMPKVLRRPVETGSGRAEKHELVSSFPDLTRTGPQQAVEAKREFNTPSLSGSYV